MNNKNKFEIGNLRGKLGSIRDWMVSHNIPPILLFYILGIISTIWFLIRVIPKPSRASYPCMRVAAPFMSGLIIYLLAVAGFTIVSRKLRKKIINVRYASTFLLVFGVIIAMAITPSKDGNTALLNVTEKTGPDDGPNQPFGIPTGVKPGRVIWAWNPDATNENCINTFDLYKPENTNQKVVNKMFADAVNKLAGKKKLRDSWNALFRAFNKKKINADNGYTKGEKIFIKVDGVSANWMVKQGNNSDGYYYPATLLESENAKKGMTGNCDMYPSVVLELLRELVYEAGVDQKDIAIGDPLAHIYGHIYDIWHNEFPDIVYIDRSVEKFGRTISLPSSTALVYYSDKTQTDKLYQIIEKADYLINVGDFKPHLRAGISLTAKNHFGSHTRRGASHLHYSLVSPVTTGSPTNGGYHKYRGLVDLMGSKYLGQNTLLYIIDGLYGGGADETKAPVKYFAAPFNNDWTSSIFISQDQVALESVCYDFLRTEWNGTHTHNPSNNSYEGIPNVNGVDDYLHQAADKVNWPAGIIYDPDNSGKPLASLGVHEHWNNPDDKQYSGNLGKTNGIELISIPDNLVKTKR
jgi:hypothetical protein